MIRDEIESVETTSPNILVEQTEQLKLIFPQVFSEGKIDFKKLRAALGDIVDGRPEKYSFTWAGKSNAIQLLQTPSHTTLTPAEDASVNFEDTQNLFIEGDNLEVLKLLYKSYSGRVKMIYIDPPYNTGNDFVYSDDFTDPLERYLEVTGQKDANGNLLTSNPETSGRYHSAWLSMMYPRLFLARQLLRDDGIIFVSIDDHEVANLRKLMDEIFGEENFYTQIIVRANSRGQTYKQIAKTHEYMLVYLRDYNTDLYEIEKDHASSDLNLQDDVGSFNLRELRNRNPKFGRHNRPNLFYPIYVNPNISDKNGLYPVSLEKTDEFNTEVLPLNSSGGESCWRWGKSKFLANCSVNTSRSNLVARKKGSGEFGIFEKYRKTTYKPKSIWDNSSFLTETGTVELRELGLEKCFDFPKPVSLIKECLKISTVDDDIVLDLFAGSGTTAQAVLELNREDDGNRQFIMVQLPEKTRCEEFPTIAEVGEERIRRVIVRIRRDDENKLGLSTRTQTEDLGFRVFKLAPSNYKQWQSIDASDPDTYTKQLDMFADLLVDNWNTINVLWEVAIKEGYGLNTQLERLEEVPDNAVWRITDPDKVQSMLVCLDDELQPSTLSALPLSKEHVFVCRNKALDDTKAANLALQCRLKKI